MLRCTRCFAVQGVHPANGGMARGTCGPAGLPGSLQPAWENSTRHLKDFPARAGVGTAWGSSGHGGSPGEEERHLRALSWTSRANHDTRRNSADTSQWQPAPKGATRAPHHPGVALGKPSGPAPGRRTTQEAAGSSGKKLAEASAHSAEAIMLLLDSQALLSPSPQAGAQASIGCATAAR